MKTSDKKKPVLTHADLEQFTGDLTRYRTLNRSVIYTPGVKYLAEQGGAYWLIDLIASYYFSNKMNQAIEQDARLATLQFWKLTVLPDKTATVTARADSKVVPIILQKIPYTDFPLDYVDVWAGFDGQFWTLYLPSEH